MRDEYIASSTRDAEVAIELIDKLNEYIKTDIKVIEEKTRKLQVDFAAKQKEKKDEEENKTLKAKNEKDTAGESGRKKGLISKMFKKQT